MSVQYQSGVTGKTLPVDTQPIMTRRAPGGDVSEFQRWFSEALQKSGLSLAELSRRTGSDYTHLWKIMRGDPAKYPTSRRPGFELTEAIGRELGDLEGAMSAAGYKTSPKDVDEIATLWLAASEKQRYLARQILEMEVSRGEL